MQSKAATVAEYLAELPEDRQKDIKKVRAVIKKNLPKGFTEVMQYGMIGYVVPHKLYPAGYHCNPKDPLPYACLAAQKNGMSLYLMSVYQDSALLQWFTKAYKESGKKLDMGKSCVRFKKADDLPLDVIGEVFARVSVEDYVKRYEAILGSRKKK